MPHATSCGRCRSAVQPRARALLVREGVSLARALKEQRLFPPVLIHLTANGEASGQLAPMLERAAGELEREQAVESAGLQHFCSPRSS
jgi:general secretion pathway protein F